VADLQHRCLKTPHFEASGLPGLLIGHFEGVDTEGCGAWKGEVKGDDAEGVCACFIAGDDVSSLVFEDEGDLLADEGFIVVL
jgi:hypothetical protein